MMAQFSYRVGRGGTRMVVEDINPPWCIRTVWPLRVHVL